MSVIPVIDLQQGVVVRGVAGQRALYRPVVSQLSNDATPAAIAQSLARAFDFHTAYVADLDAIAGAEPNWDAYEAIHHAGLSLWVDAGLGTVECAQRFLAHPRCSCCGIVQFVLGLESLADPAMLPTLLEMFKPARVIFSLDLSHGRPLTPFAVWRERSARDIAAELVAAGVQSLLVLDLAAVGVQRGPATLELGRALRADFPQLRLSGGGGVRHAADVARLASAGYSDVLVASALHDGRLTAEHLAINRPRSSSA
jgi:phosphoribosylformimino-5-aminoimidazole carboxamide ribotide isomerase